MADTRKTSTGNFSQALYLSQVYAWFRDDDAVKESASIKIVVKQNDISHFIAIADYPHARLIYAPQLTATIDLLNSVVHNRNSITFVESYLAQHFNQQSNMKVSRMTDKPIREYENAFMFKSDDTDLRDLFDREIDEMKKKGFIKKLIKKYTGAEDTFDLV